MVKYEDVNDDMRHLVSGGDDVNYGGQNARRRVVVCKHTEQRLFRLHCRLPHRLLTGSAGSAVSALFGFTESSFSDFGQTLSQLLS